MATYGNFYASELESQFDVAAEGGWLRIGFMHYNTVEEVDRLLEALERCS
jgi:selenocysteine lyase/cysteine desulfurase